MNQLWVEKNTTRMCTHYVHYVHTHVRINVDVAITVFHVLPSSLTAPIYIQLYLLTCAAIHLIHSLSSVLLIALVLPLPSFFAPPLLDWHQNNAFALLPLMACRWRQRPRLEPSLQIRA